MDSISCGVALYDITRYNKHAPLLLRQLSTLTAAHTKTPRYAQPSRRHQEPGASRPSRQQTEAEATVRRCRQKRYNSTPHCVRCLMAISCTVRWRTAGMPLRARLRRMRERASSVTATAVAVRRFSGRKPRPRDRCVLATLRTPPLISSVAARRNSTLTAVKVEASLPRQHASRATALLRLLISKLRRIISNLKASQACIPWPAPLLQPSLNRRTPLNRLERPNVCLPPAHLL